jgi:CRP-like cAMP-binding protein
VNGNDAAALGAVYGGATVCAWYPITPTSSLAEAFAAHCWRLHGMIKLIRDIEKAAQSDLNADWLLPYTRPAGFKAGDFMMKRGEYAHGAFYVASGEVELVELGKTVGAGTLLGEIGLFTPDGLRTATARCKTDVQAARIDYDRFKELYYQNPEFGFRLLHLIVARMQESSGLPRTAAATT